MALSNTEQVGRVLEALKDGLGPFILREYRLAYKGRTVDEIDAVLSTAAHRGLPNEAWLNETTLRASLDTQGCLNLMWRRWNEVFQDKLGHTGRSYVSEMIAARNTW